MNLGKNQEGLNVDVIVSDFSILLNKRLQQFEQKINTDNKIGVKTMEVLSELPMVKELQRRVVEKDAEIARLRNELKKYRETKKVTLQTNELLDNDSKVSYDDISSLVSDEVNRLEAERTRGCTSLRNDYTKPACNLPAWSWTGSACSLPTKPCLGSTNPYSFLDDDDDDEEEEESEEDEEDEDEDEEEDEDEDEDEDEEDEEEDEEEDVEEDEEEDEEEAEDKEAEGGEVPDGQLSAEAARDLAESKTASGEEVLDKEEEDDEEEGLDVDEITIDGTIYYTNDRQNGTIFKRDSDGEVGDEAGHFEDGHAFFS